MKRAVLASVVLALSSGVGATQTMPQSPDPSTLNPAALKLVLPEKLNWQPAAGLPGAETAVLVGDPGKAGFYVVMNRFQPGSFSRPHYHPNDRYIVVLSGTWWVGTGTRFDPERTTVPIKPGSFVTHVGREVHYDGARTGGEPAVVMIYGQGPGTRTECEGSSAEAGPGPCADARRAADNAQPITVFVGGAMTRPLDEIAADFTRTHGTAVVIVSDTTGGLQKRLRAGEKADLVIVATQALDALQKEALVVPAGRSDLARALMGVGVRVGSPHPDISSVDAFKRTLLSARSVSYTDPAAGGVSGTYLAGLLQKLGIADAMKPKTVYGQQGSEVAAAVANGSAEIGLTFTSELAPNKGVTVVGLLPAEIQSPTIYAAAVASAAGHPDGARALLQALRTPFARAAIVKAGLEPAP